MNAAAYDPSGWSASTSLSSESGKCLMEAEYGRVFGREMAFVSSARQARAAKAARRDETYC